jgi:hypothetical protein
MPKVGSYIILGSLSIIYFLENYNRYLLSVAVIPFINYSSYQYSLLSGTVFGVCYSAGGVILAIWNDTSTTFSSGGNANMNAAMLMKRKVYFLTVACLIFSGSFMLTGLTSNFVELAIIRMIMGFAQSVVTPFCTGIIGEYFPEALKGFAFSIFQLGTYISFSLSLSLGTYMYDKYGWQYGYLLFGAIGLVLSMGIPFLGFITPTHSVEDLESIDLFEPSKNTSFSDGNSKNLPPPHVVKNQLLWNGNYSVVQEEDFDDTYYEVNCSEAVVLPHTRGLNTDQATRSSVLSGSPSAKPQFRSLSSSYLREGQPKVVETGNNAAGQPEMVLNDGISDVSCSMGSAGSFVGDDGGQKVTQPAMWRYRETSAAEEPSTQRLAVRAPRSPSANQGNTPYRPSSEKKYRHDRTDSSTARTDESLPVGSSRSLPSAPSFREGDAADLRSSMISISLLSVRDSEAVRRGPQKPQSGLSDDNSISVIDNCCSHDGMVGLNTWEKLKLRLLGGKELCCEVLRSWNRQPVLYIICLATGLRLGAG